MKSYRLRKWEKVENEFVKICENLSEIYLKNFNTKEKFENNEQQ